MDCCTALYDCLAPQVHATSIAARRGATGASWPASFPRMRLVSPIMPGVRSCRNPQGQRGRHRSMTNAPVDGRHGAKVQHLFDEGAWVFWRHYRFLACEQVFDGEYLEARELPERRIEHARTGSFRLHRGRGLGKRDEQAHG